MILLRFYRETRMTAVNRGSFPTLLKQLWQCHYSQNFAGGFRGAGLWPFNSDGVSLEKCQNVLEDPTNPDDIGSLQRILYKAIVSAYSSNTISRNYYSPWKFKENEKESASLIWRSIAVWWSSWKITGLRIEEEERVAKKSKSRVPKALKVSKLRFSTQKTKKMNPQVNHLIKRRMIQNVLYVIFYGVVTKERSQISGLYVIFVMNIAVLSAYLLIQIFLMVFTVQNVQIHDFYLIECQVFLKHFTVQLY